MAMYVEVQFLLGCGVDLPKVKAIMVKMVCRNKGVNYAKSKLLFLFQSVLTECPVFLNFKYFIRCYDFTFSYQHSLDIERQY